MNNSEILELRKRLKFCDDASFKIEACYIIGSEKRIQSRMNTYLTNLEESDRHKYLEILKKGLSGVLNRNLLNLSFKRSMDGEDARKFLLELRDSELSSSEVLDKMYEKIMQLYSTVGNYLIISLYDAYDVPREGTDGFSQGESEEVFRYVYTCICPVNLAKAALSYHEDENVFAARIRDWVVEMPDVGFLYPAFNERSSDVNALLYYCKDPLLIHPEIISDLLGCEEEMTSVEENRIFKNVIEEVINEVPEYDTFEVVRSVQDNLTEMLEDKVFSYEPTIDKKGAAKLLRDSGIREEHLPIVEEKFEEKLGENGFLHADRIKEKGRLEVKGDNVKISVKQEASSLIEIKIIDGRKCLVVPLDSDMEVNGIIKKITAKLEEEEE
ncbi:MAG: DUF4317 domain-containing protein [Lachnospiraceae bacterium]|nr:DUF4317 domain-containing protein [Lachnospiraceae bacterium]